MNEVVTFSSWEEATLPTFDETSEAKGALEVLRWAYESYGNNITYACSFGIEGIVLIDLISKVNPQASIVFLDTNCHFKETYELIDQVKAKYPELQIHLQQPEITLTEQAELHGEELWKSNPNLCCQIRKIEPLKRTLAPVDAWISGLRREQSETRQNTNYINLDSKFQKIKICPLIHWTWKEIWRYVHKNNLPYNILHDQGYPSIGCEPCTAPTYNLEDMRSGRWAGTGKIECGLHQD